MPGRFLPVRSIAATVAFLVAGLAGAAPALASVGCDLINGGAANLAAQPPARVVIDTSFTDGDVLNLTLSAGVTNSFFTVGGVIVISGVPGPTNRTYVTPGGPQQVQVDMQGNGTLVVTCTAAPEDPEDPEDPPPPPSDVFDYPHFIADTLGTLADRERERTAAQKKLFLELETERKLEQTEIHVPLVFRRQVDRQWGLPLLGSPDESIGDGSPVINYAPTRQSPLDPSLGAISQFFDGDGAVTGSVELQSPIPGWRFGAILDGGIIERTFGALQGRTLIGSLTFAGSTTIKDTILGLGLKLGTGSATVSPSGASLSAVQLGGDLHLMRWLTPSLLGSLYGGYELGLNNSVVSGVASQFLSHTLKAGAGLKGVIALDEVTLTPALTAFLQYQHVPAFINGAGVAVPAFHTLDLDVTGGLTISRSFELVERDATAVPFLTVNGVLNYTTTSVGALTMPPDAFSLQAIGGVRLDLASGASLTFQGDITAGATTTMYGGSASLKVPLW